MSFAEYAKHRRVSPAAVSQAVAAGRITPVVDTRGRRRLDPEIADAQWSKNTDPLQSARANSPKAGATLPDGGGEGGANSAAYWDARTRREQAEASIAEMKRKQMGGELVERARVEAAAFTYGRLIRDSVLGVPSRIAPELAHEVDSRVIEQRIAAALRRVLDDVAKMSAADLERAMGATKSNLRDGTRAAVARDSSRPAGATQNE